MCQALCWGYNTDILTAQLFRLVGRNRHINRVMMQKLHTVTNLPGNRFCWSQSNLNIYLIYQNFLHGYIFFNMKMHVTGFSGGITKSDQAPTYEQLNSWVELNSLHQTENLLILQSIIFLQPLTHSFLKIVWVLFFFITLKKRRHLLALQSHLPFFLPCLPASGVGICEPAINTMVEECIEGCGNIKAMHQAHRRHRQVPEWGSLLKNEKKGTTGDNLKSTFQGPGVRQETAWWQ